MNAATKAAYLRARADYEATCAIVGPQLEAIDHLFDEDEDEWGAAVEAIEKANDMPRVRERLADAECNLIAQYYDLVKAMGGDTAAFGSPSLAIRKSLIEIALKA